MSEKEKIEQSTGDSQPATENRENVSEPLTVTEQSQIKQSEIPVTIEAANQTLDISKSEIENMEVHHHPDLHHKKKNFKEYFLEFVMIFLAVTLGFFAESLREYQVNNDKEETYMKSMIHDLKRDTAEVTQLIAFQSGILKKMDSALKIPAESLKDINMQDTFYHHFVYFYSFIAEFTPQDNTITQLKNAGGFNVIHNKMVIDSINGLNLFYESELKKNSDIYIARWQRLDEFAMQMIILPEPPDNPEDSVYTTYPHHTEMFTRYDHPLLQQLYSFIRFEQSDIEVNMDDEMRYRDQAARLIKFITEEYNLENE